MARLTTIAFAMALALCVVAPAAAQTFTSLTLSGSSPQTRGSSSLVSWTTSGSIPTVQLRVCSNTACTTQYGGILYPGSGSPYLMTIPNLAVSTTYYLEIASVGTPSIKRYSNSFSVQAVSSSILIDTVGTMTRGATKTISWTYSGSISSVNISLVYYSGGVAEIGSFVDSTSSTPSFTYAVPATLASGSLYRVRITSAEYAPVHDSVSTTTGFLSVIAASSSIAISSVGSMTRGSTKTISWTYVGTISSVNISLVYSSGVVAQIGSFIDSTSSTPSFDYEVPATLASGSLYRVRVTAAVYDPAQDPTSTTTGYFSVSAATSSISVAVSGSVSRGATKALEWTSVGSISTVNITLLASGSVVQVIALEAPNTGSFDYAVPATLPLSSLYQVRIVASKYSPAHDATVGTSSYFSVAEKQTDGGGSDSSGGGGGGGGGGAAAAIIIIIVVLSVGGVLYRRHKEQAAQRDMEKMQGINQSGQAVVVPLPADQYVTEGIPLCYFSHAAMAPPSAPPQPDTLVVPVLVPVSPVAATSPSAHYSEHTGLIAPQ